MNAKEKQKEFISGYLKIKFQKLGYRTAGNTWWLERAKFFEVISLQNSQWNSTDDVSFCLNIGPALTATLRDPKKKRASYSDLTINLREDAFLTEERRNQPFHTGRLGYLITDSTDLAVFTEEFAFDLENEILPKLNRLESLDDWLGFLNGLPFWREHLLKIINESA
ncbi:hypothetical protein BH10ACI2_BH10ACI2_12310 [soil metagenome]